MIELEARDPKALKADEALFELARLLRELEEDLAQELRAAEAEYVLGL